MTFLEKIDKQPRTTKGVVLLTPQEWVRVKALGAALDDIAGGRLNVTDAMLVSKEAMQTAIAEYSQTRAREALKSIVTE